MLFCRSFKLKNVVFTVPTQTCRTNAAAPGRTADDVARLLHSLRSAAPVLVDKEPDTKQTTCRHVCRLLLRIRSGFGLDPDPTSQHRPDLIRLRILLTVVKYTSKFHHIKLVILHSFLYSRIQKFIYVLVIQKFLLTQENYFAKELVEIDRLFS
jgi:hypothetical protein